MCKSIILLFITFCYIFLNSSCNKQYTSADLNVVVDDYLNDKPNILGAIVKVDIEGNESYEAVRGYIDSSRKNQDQS